MPFSPPVFDAYDDTPVVAFSDDGQVIETLTARGSPFTVSEIVIYDDPSSYFSMENYTQLGPDASAELTMAGGAPAGSYEIQVLAESTGGEEYASITVQVTSGGPPIVLRSTGLLGIL